MSFTTPLALLLLLAIPYFIWLSRPQLLAWLVARVANPQHQQRRTPHPSSLILQPSPLSLQPSLALLVRLLIIILLTLSLAGAQLVRAVDELAVVFLVDDSDSMLPEQAQQSQTFIRQAVAEMAVTDQAGIVLFGGNALVERPVGRWSLPPVEANSPLPGFSSQPQRLHTNFAEAIRLGLALFPAGSARRLVLISDGSATAGDTAGAGRLAAAAGVPVDTLYLPRAAATAELTLREVRAPARVSAGERFRLDIAADSTADTLADLRVLAEGIVLHEEQVQLRAGANNFTVRLQANQAAFTRYRVQLSPVEAAADTYFQNNELAAFTEVTGQPRVLLVSGTNTADDGTPLPDESEQLRLALTETGLLVETTTPAGLPATLEDLSNYAGIILVNANAADLTPRKMELLQTYVRDLGGGLVTVGGPHSYGMGGYFGTPLEATLPVDMQIRDEERFPSVSIALVIDRSGSMAQTEGGVEKIQLAAEGAARVVQLLNDNDQITVLPVDVAVTNPIGPLPAAERERAIELIRAIGAGGGGIYVRTGLEAAADALATSDNEVKHIILLADGADAEQQEGVPELIQSLTNEGVTISVVSIGTGPDVPWLQEMAQLGNGRFHLTDQAANLPQIFTQETTNIQRNYLIEERFFPEQLIPSAILSGIQSVPPLYGYVGTSPKATAQVILQTHQGDPLLATWQYGLGRAAAWTSDATGRWATEWVRWNGFPPFWAQTVRWSIGQERDSNLETAVAFMDDGRARLTIDAQDDQGEFLNNLNLQANIVAPNGQVSNLTLQQTAPGRYEATFAPQEEGAYFIGVGTEEQESGGAEEQGRLSQTAGWVLGYSPEYLNLDSDPQTLAALSEQTGGRLLDPNSDPAAVFAHNLSAEPARQPIWPWLLLTAVLLLPVDVALRRLVLTRDDWRRAQAAILGRLPTRAPRPTPQPRTEQVSRLFEAKERLKERPPVVDQPPTAEPPPPPTTMPEVEEVEVKETAVPPPSGSDLAARLLERKRGRGTLE